MGSQPVDEKTLGLDYGRILPIPSILLRVLWAGIYVGLWASENITDYFFMD